MRSGTGFDPYGYFGTDYSDPPLIIDLAANGIAQGDLLSISVTGTIQYWVGAPDWVPWQVTGLFSASETVLDRAELHRVPGAINAGVRTTYTFNTWNGDLPGDIPEDFEITPLTPTPERPRGCQILVPRGAKYLMVQATDSGWSDNSGSVTVAIHPSKTSAAGIIVGYGNSGAVASFDASTGLMVPEYSVYNPHGLAWGLDGSLYVASFGGGFVRRFPPNAETAVDIVTGLPLVNGLRFGPDGKLYLFQSSASSSLASVRRCYPDGSGLETVAMGNGFAVHGVFDSNGNLYVTNLRPELDGGISIWRISAAGVPSGFAWNMGGATGIAMGSDGMLYVANYQGQVFRLHLDGSCGGMLAEGLGALHGMTFGPDGNLYVTNLGDYASPANVVLNNRVLLLNPEGALIGSISNETATGALLRPLYVTGPSATVVIPALANGVQALVSSGVVLPADGNSLQVKLNAALGYIAAGDTLNAIGKLNDFINQVRAFVKTGRISAVQGQSLIDQANAAIAGLSG